MIGSLKELNSALVRQSVTDKNYRSVFSDGNGQIVLFDMLYDLFFLREATTEGEMALNNYAKTLLLKIYGKETPAPELLTRLKNIIRKSTKRKKKHGRTSNT